MGALFIIALPGETTLASDVLREVRFPVDLAAEILWETMILE
jgi:hypothetical protein